MLHFFIIFFGEAMNVTFLVFRFTQITEYSYSLNDVCSYYYRHLVLRKNTTSGIWDMTTSQGASAIQYSARYVSSVPPC